MVPGLVDDAPNDFCANRHRVCRPVTPVLELQFLILEETHRVITEGPFDEGEDRLRGLWLPWLKT